MRNRTRRSAQPMLESIEPRVAPSAAGIHVHHDLAVAVHIAKVHSPDRLAGMSQRANEEALQRLQHQLHVIYMRSLERTPSALPTKAEQEASEVSNILQSIGQSL